MTPISYFERVSIIIYVFNKQIIVFIIIKSVSNSKNRIVKSRSLVRSQKSEKQRFFPIAIAKKIFFASIKFHLLFSIRNRYKIAIIIKNRSRSRSAAIAPRSQAVLYICILPKKYYSTIKFNAKTLIE